MQMKKSSRISPAEWRIMKVIWAGPPMMAREVISQLAEEENWHPKTIRTLLARLVKKRVLGYKKSGRAYVYRPLVKETDGVKTECQSFVNRVFGGDIVRLFSTFLEGRKLTDGEAKELRRLVGAK